MIGPASDRGVNLRAIDYLFSLIDETEDMYRHRVNISILEVYNEKIIDLLASPRDGHDLEIRTGKEGNYVENLTEWQVKSVTDVTKAITVGENSRKVANNNINEHSSRSHLIIYVKVMREDRRTGVATVGSLYLVDLAGSERIKATDASGDRLREAQHINKSLSSLGDVINALATNQKHIPYRNSKLTFLLQDSLRDNSRVIMFVNVNPNADYAQESTCSLNFASRCRSVQLGRAKVNPYHGHGR